MEDRYIDYMTSYSELRPHHNKVIKVILSCKTYEQMGVAEKYSVLFYQLHSFALKDSYPSEAMRYQSALLQSQALVQRAFSFQRKRIKIQFKKQD